MIGGEVEKVNIAKYSKHREYFLEYSCRLRKKIQKNEKIEIRSRYTEDHPCQLKEYMNTNRMTGVERRSR